MKRIAPEWNRVLVACNVKPITAAIWSEIFAACIDEKTFSAGDEDVRNFLAQTLYETQMLEHLEENLNYSAERLAVVWPNRYAVHGPDGRPVRPLRPNKLALSLDHKPERIANNCYANRMGNGGELMGDGWKYRGRGFPMCTGKANYELVQKATGLPVVAKPQLLSQPLTAMQAGIAWWERSVPDAILYDPEKVTEAVQGGDLGLAERVALTERTSQALS